MSITIDDRDFSLTYDGSWFHGGQAQFEYDNTTTGTNTAGSMALFGFTGVSVSVFGTVGPINYAGQDVGAPISSYQVDDLPVVIFTAPAQSGTLFHYNFFTSSTLGNGPHRLTITNINQSSYLWIDYVQYTPSPAILSSSSPLNSQQPTATSSSTTPGAQTGPSSSSSPVPQNSVQTTKKDNAPVIGGVVGGVVLVVAVLALIFYLRRRRNARAVAGETDVDNARLNTAEASVSEVRSNHNFSITSNAPLGLDDRPRSNRPQSSVTPPSVRGVENVRHVADPEANNFLPHQIADEGPVYLHEDSGVRIAGGSLHGQVEIPPEYREYL